MGLCVAKTFGATNLIVECDSKKMVEMMNAAMRGAAGGNNVIQRAVHEAASIQEVVFKHVYREQNRAADTMAKMALNRPIGLQVFLETPQELSEIMDQDRMGATFPRRVSRAIHGEQQQC
ncbi:PREDICTED: uncharacterized protein LOC109190924 [Ipomoea nil]|uniref:uncharacterized protein LOC109190924 n=1 Tax=Ipomoea nil TaxID=35883 RepID=UPI000901CE95|nr:PREDICTED: uncharacterized protein LOC109190924 [Ipomoea nil]